MAFIQMIYAPLVGYSPSSQVQSEGFSRSISFSSVIYTLPPQELTLRR
jgi:hypothetical protein